jgi:hypothetical protein
MKTRPILIMLLGFLVFGSAGVQAAPRTYSIADDKTDLVWRNKSTGETIVWFMNCTTYSNYAELLQVADTNWEIVGPK